MCVSVPIYAESLDLICVSRTDDKLCRSLRYRYRNERIKWLSQPFVNVMRLDLRTTLGPQAVVRRPRKTIKLHTASLFRNWIQWPQMNLSEGSSSPSHDRFLNDLLIEPVKSCVKLFTDGCPTDSSLSKYLFSFTLCTARFFSLFAFHSKISLVAFKVRVHADRRVRRRKSIFRGNSWRQ